MFPFLPILGSVLGGLFSSSAASNASQAQTTAAQNDLAFQQSIYDQQQANLAPYLAGGDAANAALMYELGLGPKPQGYTGYETTPGYDFQLQQGNQAIEASAAARGGLYSGAAMRDLQNNGLGMAAQGRNNYLAQLFGAQGVGLNAAGMNSSAANSLAVGGSNAYNNMGNAASAGYVGQANALNNGIQDLTSIWGYQNALKPPTTSGSGGYSFTPFGG